MDNKSKIRSMEELHKFCVEFDYAMELEKPFDGMDGMFLTIVDSEKSIVSTIIIQDIREVEAAASELLGDLSKKH